MRGIFNKKKGKLTQPYQLTNFISNELAGNSSSFIDNSKLSIDTKLSNHFKPSKSNHSNDANEEAFDLQTYKKFLSFLKFQEMMDKYNT